MGIVKERFCPYNDPIDRSLGFKVFSTFERHIFFRYARNDTLYQFDNTGRLTDKLLFDFGKFRLSLKSITDVGTMSQYQNNPDIARIMESFHTYRHIFISYIFENRYRFLLFHKQSEEIINVSFLENDIDGISLANPTPIYAWQNQLFYIKEASVIVEQKKDGKPIYESISQLSHLNENDNPVIVIAYLKSQ